MLYPDKTTGELLRILRAVRRLTQEDLAQIAGCSRAMISLVESDRAAPTVGLALRIAAAVGVTVENLWGRRGCWKTERKD